MNAPSETAPRTAKLLSADRHLFAVVPVDDSYQIIKFGPRYFVPCMSGSNKDLHGVDVYIEAPCYVHSGRCSG